MGKTYSGDDILQMLRERVNSASQKQVAAELGLSQQFMNDVLHGRRVVTVRLAEAMGFEQVITYRKVA